MKTFWRPAAAVGSLFTIGIVACAYGQRPTPPGRVAPPAEPPAVFDPSRLYTTPEDIAPPQPKPKVVVAPEPRSQPPKLEVRATDEGRGPGDRRRAEGGPQAVANPKEPAPQLPAEQKRPKQPMELVMKEGVKYRRRIAAVIGISKYADFPPLEGARDDATRIAERLRGARFDQVTELYDDQATRKAILSLLGTEFPKKADTHDLVVIYFAGHGQTETLPNGEKRGYIVPVDGEKDDVFSTSISMEQVRDLSNRIPASHVYYAMDSCYSGLGLVRAVGPIGSGGFQLTTASERAVKLITAGTEGQQAEERGGRGLFTTYLLRGLDGEADANGDRILTADEVGGYVTEQVAAASRRRQTPQYGTLEGRGEITFVLGR